jgi:cyclophilin family peptidyl-prolyl cis-trans isomerase
MRGRILIAVSLVALAVSLALIPDGLAGATSRTARGCRVVHPQQPRTEHLRRPPQTVTAADRLVAIVRTSCGRFRIRLDASRQPVTVNSFVYLARSGFYDGLSFYRVVPRFVIQGGDPTTSGRGGPGYSTTEAPPRHFRFRVGTVAMAKTYEAPRGRAGSIFFVIAGKEGRKVPDDYAILGQVVAGMRTVKRIDGLGTEDETPSQAVKIDWIRIRAA